MSRHYTAAELASPNFEVRQPDNCGRFGDSDDHERCPDCRSFLVGANHDWQPNYCPKCDGDEDAPDLERDLSEAEYLEDR